VELGPTGDQLLGLEGGCNFKTIVNDRRLAVVVGDLFVVHLVDIIRVAILFFFLVEYIQILRFSLHLSFLFIII